MQYECANACRILGNNDEDGKEEIRGKKIMLETKRVKFNEC